MKRLFLIVSFLFLYIGVNAQDEDIYNVSIARSETDLLINGKTLSPQQEEFIIQDILGKEYSDLWMSAKRSYSFGKFCQYSGWIVIGTGLFTASSGAAGLLMIPFFSLFGSIFGGDPDLSNGMKTCGLMAVTGIIITYLGELICNRGKLLGTKASIDMDNVIDSFNSEVAARRQGQLSLGPTNNGFGLCYRF